MTLILYQFCTVTKNDKTDIPNDSLYSNVEIARDYTEIW